MQLKNKKQPVVELTRNALKRIAGLDEFPQPAVIPVRYPVVLMHGFGMLAIFLRGGHLHDEAIYLRLRGVPAYAPNVSPYHTVPVRAEMWQDRIGKILEETRADAINLIAHSMGGLDARFMISELGMHNSVASLVTMSTPHRGSSLADIVLESPERVQGWLTDAANWAGSSVLEGGSADFHRAVRDLTPAHVTGTFNRQIQDHESVRYWSYAGRAGKGTDSGINPLLRPQNILIYKREGVNDGFVSVESAKWGTYLGTVDADHSQQVGVDLTPSGTFDSTEFYAGIVSMLAAEGL
ncbi:MAG: alpha/beta fold hydrolase [Rhodothermia bacterium]|nr:MAG: alpha/beta fold hydrolase [Rhodothermia bacterium]